MMLQCGDKPKSKKESGDSIGGEDIYSSKEEELVLVLLSELYSELKAIFCKC